MISTVTQIGERLYKVSLDYTDEGVELADSRTVSGDYADAVGYVRHFDRDMRTAHTRLFPVPDPEHYEEEV